MTSEIRGEIIGPPIDYGSLTIWAGDSEVVTISGDGIEIHGEHTVDDAARAFWLAVGR